MKKLLFVVAALAILVSAAPEKKNVLIIGDSISIGYTPFVIAELKDEANVVRIKGNSETSTNCVAKIDTWLGDTKWDVIHFNCGLWDLCYRHPNSTVQGNRDKINGTISTSVEEYAQNLEIIVKRLKETGAELIFATITYVPSEEEGRFVEDAQIYNAAALKVMKRHGVKINDLYKPSAKIHAEQGQGKNNVHYKKVGYQTLSEYVVKAIRKRL